MVEVYKGVIKEIALNQTKTAWRFVIGYDLFTIETDAPPRAINPFAMEVSKDQDIWLRGHTNNIRRKDKKTLFDIELKADSEWDNGSQPGKSIAGIHFGYHFVIDNPDSYIIENVLNYRELEKMHKGFFDYLFFVKKLPLTPLEKEEITVQAKNDIKIYRDHHEKCMKKVELLKSLDNGDTVFIREERFFMQSNGKFRRGLK